MCKGKVLLIAMLVVALVSGISLNATVDAKAADPKFLTVGTANTGGAYYPIGIAMADLLSNKLKISSTAQTTGGAVENNTLIQNKRVDLAITQGSMAHHAYYGIEPYKSKLKDVSLMFSGLSKGVFQVIVNDNSPIKSISDLKGKRVVLGPAGGGGIPTAADVLSVYGMTLNDIKPVYVNYDDGANDLTSGYVDAVVIQSAIPSPAIFQLTAAKKDIRLLSLDDAGIKKLLKKFPYYSRIDIDQSVYKFSTVSSTIYVSNVVIVNKSLSTDLVYRMTKLFFENIDRITASHPAAKDLTLKNAVTGIPIPLHPGAKKYFKEKGVL
ncbi:MAG TPA: TAXI family TRAP transporter solute-binding subunit [Bacillota bacterium]|nr:TAXI family TRAP transporter solute-binding subunit [Bacillota bacterium]